MNTDKTEANCRVGLACETYAMISRTARFRALLCYLCSSVFICGYSPVFAAPPNPTYLYPAGAQRGSTVNVLVAGTFDRWPVRIWADASGIDAKALKDKGKLTVTVAANVVPGTHWLRFHDDEGASALRPFIVGTLPEVMEQEPNDDPKKPQVLASSLMTVNGRLEKPGDVDCFAVKLTKGQTLVASLLANRVLGSPMDGIMQVVSADGFVLAENNDYHDLDPQIVFTAPANGTYIVRLFAFPLVPDSSIRFAGAETFIYRLTLTTGPFAEHAFPLAVPRSSPGQVELIGWNLPDAARKVAVKGEIVFHPLAALPVSIRLEPHAVAVKTRPATRERPQTIALPVTVSGRLEPGDIDVYQFEAKKGQRLVFQAEARALGFALDPTLRLTDSAGKMLAQADDTGMSRDPELAFAVPADGNYRIEVRDLHGYGGPRYVYRLRALLPVPDYELTVTADRFLLTPGKPLDIAVTIDRRNGFVGNVTLGVEGLPDGVTAAPVQTTGKTATLKLTAAKGPIGGSIRIVGIVESKEMLTRTARAGTTTHIWLTVAAAKK
jgi:hypothetical protein